STSTNSLHDARPRVSVPLRVDFRSVGTQGPDVADQGGVGARVLEVDELPVQGGDPELRAQVQTTTDVAELGRGQPGGCLPRRVPGDVPGRGVALGRSPVHVELPGDLLDGPPVLRVQYVHHEPVLLTLHGSLLSGA